MEIDNLTFNDLPQAVSVLISQVSSMRSEVAQMRQQLQQARTEDNLILGQFYEWEIIYTRDERLRKLVSKYAITHWKDVGLPFHHTVTGGLLYTTPRELEAYLNPHREAMGKLKKII